MIAQINDAVSQAGKQKNVIITPGIFKVGIKFVIISAGKLYPGKFEIKNIHGLMQKEIASHL